jgi:hypothetical protein
MIEGDKVHSVVGYDARERYLPNDAIWTTETPKVGPISELESVSIIRTAARLVVFRVRRDRRTRRRRSARCEKRGV